MINWRVRLENKTFWLTAVPAVLVLVQAILHACGVEWDFGEVGNNIAAIVNAAFTLLAILGIAVDPTTKGIGDSSRALNYDKPNEG